MLLRMKIAKESSCEPRTDDRPRELWPRDLPVKRRSFAMLPICYTYVSSIFAQSFTSLSIFPILSILDLPNQLHLHLPMFMTDTTTFLFLCTTTLLPSRPKQRQSSISAVSRTVVLHPS